MIGLIVGTSEGKKIISMLNEFTDDLFISTATQYGAELLEDYKYKILNSKPLDLEHIIKVIRENNITMLIDASHPYALEITDNSMKASKICGIEYVRYERPSIVDKYSNYEKLIQVPAYEELYKYLKDIEGNILNTSGSRNINSILKLGLKNRIIHRVLPTLKVLNECFNLGVKVEDIVAIKGPISYELNSSFIREYDAKAIIMKDSGVEGGTEEKLKAAISQGIYALVIKRSTKKFDNVFTNVEHVVSYAKGKIIEN